MSHALNTTEKKQSSTFSAPVSTEAAAPKATLGQRIVTGLKDAGNTVRTKAGQFADSTKAACQSGIEKAGKAFSSAKENAGVAAQTVKTTLVSGAEKLAATPTNLGQAELDQASDKVTTRLDKAILKTRTAGEKVVDTKIDLSNGKFFGIAGPESNKVIKAAIHFQKAAAKHGDTISRGAARATYLGTKAVLTPILSLGGAFKGGQVVAEAIATGLAAVVRGVGTVATAFFTYLPEILTLGAIAGLSVATGGAAGVVFGLTATALVGYIVHNEANKAGIVKEAKTDANLARSQAELNARKERQADLAPVKNKVEQAMKTVISVGKVAEHNAKMIANHAHISGENDAGFESRIEALENVTAAVGYGLTGVGLTGLVGAAAAVEYQTGALSSLATRLLAGQLSA